MVRRRRFFVVVFFDFLVVVIVVAAAVVVVVTAVAAVVVVALLARKIRRRMFDIVGLVGAEEGQREREKDISLPPAVPFAELERPFPPPPPPRLTAPRCCAASRVYARSHRQPARRAYRSDSERRMTGETADRGSRVRARARVRDSTPSPGNRARTTVSTNVKFVVTRPVVSQHATPSFLLAIFPRASSTFTAA